MSSEQRETLVTDDATTTVGSILAAGDGVDRVVAELGPLLAAIDNAHWRTVDWIGANEERVKAWIYGQGGQPAELDGYSPRTAYYLLCLGDLFPTIAERMTRLGTKAISRVEDMKSEEMEQQRADDDWLEELSDAPDMTQGSAG